MIATLALGLVAASIVSQMAYSESGDPPQEPWSMLLEEDFEDHPVSYPPPNWTIVRPGYGVSGIWVEQSFHKDNKWLRMSSFSNMRALITHNISPTSEEIEIQLRIRISEERTFLEVTDQVAFAFGLNTPTSSIKLLELGRSDNQTVMPFNHSYSQGSWIPFRLRANLTSGSSQVYMWDTSVGRMNNTPVAPEEVSSIYIFLGGGAWYVGQFDDILVTEYPVPEPVWTLLSALALLGIVRRSPLLLVQHAPNGLPG